jgi:hypothetical protein
LRSSPFLIISISSITKVFKYFGADKRDVDPLNVTLLHLYFQNYIIMKKMERIGLYALFVTKKNKMERIGNRDDPNSFFLAL